MKELTKAQLGLWTGANIVVALLLFWATERHSYDYYVLLRWITCAVCVGGIIAASFVERKVEPWLYGIIGVLFNPLFPVHLSRQTWQPIDVIVGIGFVIAAIDKLRFVKSAPSHSPPS